MNSLYHEVQEISDSREKSTEELLFSLLEDIKEELKEIRVILEKQNKE